MPAQQAFYTCPDCGGEFELHDHPTIIAAMTHHEGCSMTCEDDPNFVTALGRLFAGREMIADGGKDFLAAESAEGDNMIGNASLLVFEGCNDIG